VDNNAEFCALLVALLRSEGYDVHSATGSAAARNLLAARRFDVLLCDIYLGPELGLDLVREQQPTLSRHKTLTIAMSADDSSRAECRALGVTFLLKSTSIDDLVVLIRRSTGQ
jgi:two-component system, NtrC family, response regulator PilR